MFRAGHFRRLLLATFLLSSVALFAQRYQAHDHGVFHRLPAPAPKHAVTATAGAASGAHATDAASHRHEATFNTLPSSHAAQPGQVPPPRSK